MFILAIILIMASLGLGQTKAAETDSSKIIANPAGNPIDQLTGKIWQDSIDSNKEAILFGIDLGVATNYFAAQKIRELKEEKARKKMQAELSWFDRCWIKAFTNISRKEAVKKVDDWYAAHPDQLDRPVMSVLWHEVVIPELEKKQ